LATAAPVFGWMLDHGNPSATFSGAALLLLLGMASASAVGLAVRRRGAPAGVAA
jgi:hypothetical protein